MKIKYAMNVVECSDNDVIYGILETVGITPQEVQRKIFDIKNKFYDEHNDSWTIEDVFDKFPEEWEWEFIPTAIVEI